jgi:hypothetical protein
MRIDTDQWMTLSEACVAGGFTQSTGYRLAQSLGLIKVVFGVKIVRKADVKTMQENRKRIGNPDWIESYDAAAAAALRAVESRERRKKKAAKESLRPSS